jgi:hypothetical protein
MTNRLKANVPSAIWQAMQKGQHWALLSSRRGAEFIGLVIARKADSHSSLPRKSELRKPRARWDRPGALRGVDRDLDAFRQRFASLITRYGEQLRDLPSFAQVARRGYCHGFSSSTRRRTIGRFIGRNRCSRRLSWPLIPATQLAYRPQCCAIPTLPSRRGRFLVTTPLARRRTISILSGWKSGRVFPAERASHRR